MRCSLRVHALRAALALLASSSIAHAQPTAAPSASAFPAVPAESTSAPLPAAPAAPAESSAPFVPAVPVAPSASAPPPANSAHATSSSRAAEPPLDLRRGVIVASADDASTESAWELATRVYGNPLLRPRHVDDATARVLVGEPPKPGATPRLVELFELRRSFSPTHGSASRLLASFTRQLDASAVLVVWTAAPGQVRGRLFVASRSSFDDHEFAPVLAANLQMSWAGTAAWLHERARASQPAPSPAQTPPVPPPRGGGFLSSAWFWGALVLAAGAGVLAYSVSSRDEAPTTVHLQGRVVP